MEKYILKLKTQGERSDIHVGGPFPLCRAVVVVDIVRASQVVHLLFPAWGQWGQQLLRSLGARVRRLIPSLKEKVFCHQVLWVTEGSRGHRYPSEMTARQTRMHISKSLWFRMGFKLGNASKMIHLRLVKTFWGLCRGFKMFLSDKLLTVPATTGCETELMGVNIRTIINKFELSLFRISWQRRNHEEEQQ